MDQSEREEKEAILNLWEKMAKEMHKMSNETSTPAKLNAVKKAQAYIEEIEEYSLARSALEDFDEIAESVGAMVRVYPVVDAVERSYKAKFKGNAKSELSALQDAMWEVRTNNVDDEDFELAGITPEGDDEILTLEGLLQRCKELGWQPPN